METRPSMNMVKHNSRLSSLVPRPSHPSVCRLQYKHVLQVTNAGPVEKAWEQGYRVSSCYWRGKDWDQDQNGAVLLTNRWYQGVSQCHPSEVTLDGTTVNGLYEQGGVENKLLDQLAPTRGNYNDKVNHFLGELVNSPTPLCVQLWSWDKPSGGRAQRLLPFFYHSTHRKCATELKTENITKSPYTPVTVWASSVKCSA